MLLCRKGELPLLVYIDRSDRLFLWRVNELEAEHADANAVS
jgi:hypothetical protein